MIKRLRQIAYSISGVALIFFFLLPDPNVSVLGALILQTLAFITIAGKSPVDGFFLCAISLILIGIIPANHPLITGSEAFENARTPLILSGAILGVITLSYILYTARKPGK